MMLLEEFNKIIQQYKDQINKLQSQKDDFIAQNKENVEKNIQQRKIRERSWFIKNFDKIWENRNLFSLGTPNASIIIDSFEIYLYFRNCCGRCIKKITIGRLIKLWELGYVYNGYPIIEYRDTFSKKDITYIKENQLHRHDLTQEHEKISLSETILTILKKDISHFDDFDNYRTITDIKNIITTL